MQPSELIAAKGILKIADAIKARPGTVKQWKTRNKIPRDHWPELTKAFPDLTLDKLLKVERAAQKAA
jgi:hypothetical protein